MQVNKELVKDIKDIKIKDINSFIKLYLTPNTIVLEKPTWINGKLHREGECLSVIESTIKSNRLLNDFLYTIDFLKKNNMIEVIPNIKKPMLLLFEKLSSGDFQKYDFLTYEKTRYNNSDLIIKNKNQIKRFLKYGVIDEAKLLQLIFSKKSYRITFLIFLITLISLLIQIVVGWDRILTLIP